MKKEETQTKHEREKRLKGTNQRWARVAKMTRK